MKLFYDHFIIKLGPVYAEIEKFKVKQSQKTKFSKLIDETVHHTVLDTILSSLEKKYHKKFLRNFHLAPHDPSHLEFLKDKIEDIEEKIQASILNLSDNLLNKSKS